jgi:hypothetical protein
MTPQPQQPEFIISLGLLLRIERLLGYEIDQIRSRPHTSTPNLHTCTHKEIRNDVEFCHYYDSPTDPSVIAQSAREQVLQSLLNVVKTREDEMSRKANLTENMTTATGYFTSAGALNWVVQEIEKSLRAPTTKEQS